MKRTNWMLLVPLSLAAVGCGDDGPVGESADGGDDLGIEVITADDGLHGMHTDDHEAEAPTSSAVPAEAPTSTVGALGGTSVDAPDDGGLDRDGGEAQSGMPVLGHDDVDETISEAGDESNDGGHDADDAAADSVVDDEGVVVNVEMVEFGFVADVDEVPLGEPVTFRFVNSGLVPHEAMFGTNHQQEEYATAGDHGDHDGAGHHGEVTAITLDPGVTADITLEFSEPGVVWIGCHLPGHYDAGMASNFAVV